MATPLPAPGDDRALSAGKELGSPRLDPKCSGSKHPHLQRLGYQMAQELAGRFNQTGVGAYNHARNAGFNHHQATVIARISANNAQHGRDPYRFTFDDIEAVFPGMTKGHGNQKPAELQDRILALGDAF